MMLIDPMIDEAPRMCTGEDRHVDRDALLDDERGIERPAGAAAPPGTRNEPMRSSAAGMRQPEAPVVHPRERHVGRAHLHRHEPVREADERRHDRAEHHHQAVHRGERIEEHRVHELQAGLE
jgi:hypothetical protein